MVNKNVFILFIGSFTPLLLVSQVEAPPTYGNKGFERTIRENGNWEWGTLGHGSFEDVIKLYNAEKNVMTYKNYKEIYRVFSVGDVNYVEVIYAWNGGTFTYTTKSDSAAAFKKQPKNQEPVQNSIPQSDLQKVIRTKDNWDWGTCDHGTFDQAAKILNENNNIILLKDPINDRIKYRIFSHGALNFIEIDYGWKGGIFTYTTHR